MQLREKRGDLGLASVPALNAVFAFCIKSLAKIQGTLIELAYLGLNPHRTTRELNLGIPHVR